MVLQRTLNTVFSKTKGGGRGIQFRAREKQMTTKTATCLCALIILLTVTGCGDSTPPATTPASSGPQPVVFTDEGVPGAIGMGMRQVLGEGNAKAAMREDKDGRWVILLLDYENKYYQLDKGLSAADFPQLETAGFRPAADNIAQNVLLYRNMAKRAMAYTEGSDKLVIVLCPKANWGEVKLFWPAKTK